MREEVLLLQCARNDVEFKLIAGMLLDVWREKEVGEINDFAKYFEDTWVSSDLCNWHEGTTTNCANTNGLESTNKRIKEDFLTRTMQTVPEELGSRSNDVGGVHRVYSSLNFNGPFYECSCHKGCKKNVCKHAVMVMCSLEKIYEYTPEALASR